MNSKIQIMPCLQGDDRIAVKPRRNERHPGQSDSKMYETEPRQSEFPVK